MAPPRLGSWVWTLRNESKIRVNSFLTAQATHPVSKNYTTLVLFH
jgi:hypothetical protein